MNQPNLPYAFIWSNDVPHVAWADIQNNGVLAEIAVLGIDPRSGDLYFLPIAALDSIDNARLVNILKKRDAARYPLWDLMSSTTFKNGVNALEYFNQLVKVKSYSGQVFTPNSGKIGAPLASLSQRPNTANIQDVPQQSQVQTQTLVQPQAEQQDATAQAEKRGPGRPPTPKK